MVRPLATSAATALIVGRLIVPGHAGAPADRTLSDSIVVLERAVNALTSPSADSSRILRGVLSAWPTAGQPFVKADLTTFLSRVPDARSDYKCGPDFVRSRARRELLRLKDVLLDANAQPARPQFCYAVPFAIDPTQAIVPIEIYGYDFDREPVQVLLMNAYGFRDVTFALIRRAHYHLTLDLGSHGLQFSSDNQRLALTVGHLIQHAIPVIQADTPLCKSRVEESPAGKTIGYAPPLLDDQKSLSGSGAQVLANATLDYESNQLDATVCMTAVDHSENRRASSGCAVELVYATESDRVIEGVLGGLEDRVAYTLGDASEETRKGVKRGPVSEWTFGGLGGKARTAQDPRVTIRLRTTRVISTKTEGCVSAITYLEARRMHALSRATVRRLDAQLKGVDLAGMKVRPRFAPS